MNSHQGGFSLVETLVVLTAVFVIILASVSVLPKYQSKKELEAFLKQFSKDFHYAQMYAVNHQQIVEININMYQKRYFINTGAEERLVSREFPGNIEFQKDGLPLRVYFTSIGNVSNFGNWVFVSKDVRYIFTILIGRGRHYYREY